MKNAIVMRLLGAAAFVSLGSGAAAASTTLLSWNFSDKTCSVALTVGEDGAVTHTQTCPGKTPPTTTYNEAPLTPADVATLTAAIDLAGEGPYTKHDPAVTTDTPYAGQLVGTGSDGTAVFISKFNPPNNLSTGVALIDDAKGAADLLSFLAQRWGLALPPLAN